jgi:hypothetical protein
MTAPLCDRLVGVVLLLVGFFWLEDLVCRSA